MLKSISLICLALLVSSCTLYESDAKKLLRQKAFSCYNANDCELYLFQTCSSTESEPEFLKNDNLDEFSVDANIIGLLDNKSMLFWSYTKKQSKHIFCSSSIKDLKDQVGPFEILTEFSKALKEL